MAILSAKAKEQLKVMLSKFNIKLEESKIEMKVTGKLSDGTEIFSPADAFATDAEVFVVDADGNQMPAPDGEHVIDGTMKVVVAGGKITTVETVEAPAEEELSAEITAVIEDLGSRIKTLEDAATATQAELATAKTDLEKANKENVDLKAKVTQLSKAPAASSVKDKDKKEVQLSKTEIEKPWAEMTLSERIENPEKNPQRRSVKQN